MKLSMVSVSLTDFTMVFSTSRDMFDTGFIIAGLIVTNAIISTVTFFLIPGNILVKLVSLTIILWVFYWLAAESFLISFGLSSFEAGLQWVLVWFFELYAFKLFVRGMES